MNTINTIEFKPFNSELVELLEKTVKNLACFGMSTVKEEALLADLKNLSLNLFRLKYGDDPTAKWCCSGKGQHEESCRYADKNFRPQSSPPSESDCGQGPDISLPVDKL